MRMRVGLLHRPVTRFDGRPEVAGPAYSGGWERSVVRASWVRFHSGSTAE